MQIFVVARVARLEQSTAIIEILGFPPPERPLAPGTKPPVASTSTQAEFDLAAASRLRPGLLDAAYIGSRAEVDGRHRRSEFLNVDSASRAAAYRALATVAAAHGSNPYSLPMRGPNA